ncbi:hypothetical protein ACFW88_33130 [Streptomyces anandii]|uniref:DUF4232 domain-containing protein n=1 Tax=Streptomyces anandii TaxID=285454 RepID=A0ABW6HFA8_9ACTN
MGSLRKPVGPLPPSIYWRRRVVLLSVVALLTLLIVWILTSGGGGHHDNGGGSNGKNPTPSTITPGPSQSGPAISQHPGGRDESTGGDGSGSGSSSGSGSGSGSGGAGGDGSGSGSGAGTGVTDDGAKGGGGTIASLPADTTLPNCTSGAVKLTLRSVRNSYSPGQLPAFEVTAKNTSAGDCKIDLGPKSTVVTVTKAGSSDDYWSSADCPKGAGSLLYRVPAGSGITYTLRWDRKPSAPQCATPPAGSAGAGTYLVQAQVPGYGKLQTSFVLSAD